MPGLKDLPGVHTIRFSLPVPMAAAGTDDEYPALVVPWNATFVAARWTPLAAVTANGTNFTIVSIRNRGAAAAGTTLPASRSYAATNSVAFVAETMTNSATASDLSLAAGDVLTVQRLHTAAGVVVPAGFIEVDLQVR